MSASRQRGVVVIVAMLVVALAATAASRLAVRQDLALRHLESGRELEQARWLLEAGTLWARVILRTDARSSAVDHAGELWASGLPRSQVEQGWIAGEIRDQQGLFNLNNVVRDGRPSLADIAALRRLLAAIGLKAGLADALTDWIDADSGTWSDDGAEDDYYLRQNPPRRPANQALTVIEELRGVRGFDEAAIERLRRFATVLPGRTAVNVNLAPPEVLVAVVEGLTLPEAAALASRRTRAAFSSREEFRAQLPRSGLGFDNAAVAVDSRYFVVEGRATVGRVDLQMQSLVHREGAGLPRIVWRRTS